MDKRKDWWISIVISNSLAILKKQVRNETFFESSSMEESEFLNFIKFHFQTEIVYYWQIN